MNILLANDHAGTSLKNEIKKALENKGYSVINLGCDTEESVDYPDFAHPLACLLYTSPSPRDRQKSRMPSSA